MKTSFFRRVSAKIDEGNYLIYVVWFLLLLLLVVTLKLQYFSLLFPAIFANIGIIIYLFFKKIGKLLPERGTDNTEQEDNNGIQIDRTIQVVSTIFFFVFFSISLLSLLGESYTKGILYYLCVSICAAILIFEIFSVKSLISRYGILFQTFLLSLNIVFANHLIFIRGITQPDYYFHYFFVKDILTTGFITTFHEYGLVNVFAIHHIFAAEVTLLTGYNLQSIYFLLGSFIVVIGVLFVFVIGKRFVNFQFGLISAVVFTCLDFYLMWAEHPEHVAYSFGFALICFTIILYTYRTQKPAFYLLFLISVIAMVFTHHLTAVIVFATICSLVLIDIFYIVQTRERSFPSSYIAITFTIMLFAALYIVSNGDWGNLMQIVNTYIVKYFIKINELIVNFFPSPATGVSMSVTPIPVTPIPVTPIPVTPIPVTPIPVTPIPVTPIPVTPIPVTPIPVTPIPVTPIPVTPIPVTPIPVTPVSYEKLISLPISPRTGYDKLPLFTLFANTLGSSLLVFVSILGFCSCLKKRLWFGIFTIVNAILISMLLVCGVLFPIIVFLPDRMYPLLQIFGLVFLGAFGIVWLRNSIPSRNKLIIVAGICIFVGMMSFFSLASIINGFETSLFVGEDVTYPKLYTTSQDVSFGEWRNFFIPDEKRNILHLPVNNKGMIDTVNQTGNSYFIFDKTRLKTGLITSEPLFGQISFIRIANGQFRRVDAFSTYYDNGLVTMMANYSHA